MSTELQLLEQTIIDYKGKKGSLIPILQKAQKIFGYLPQEALQLISQETGVSLSKIYGVATFYAQFHFEPHGRNTIQVCRGTACHVKGSKQILDEIEDYLGITDGQTTPDLDFTLQTVACLGTCFLAPVIMVNDKYYGKLKPGEAVEVLQRYQKETRKTRVKTK